VDHQLLRFQPAVAQGPVEGFHYQGCIHAVSQLPANNTAAVPINPDRSVPPTSAGADVGDVTRPIEVRSWGLEVLLQQILHHPTGRAVGLGAGPERPAGLGPQGVEAHQPSDAMQPDMAAGCTEITALSAARSPGASCRCRHSQVMACRSAN
jgi:hypothetical protein